MSADSVLQQVMASTALPTNADTFFTQLAGPDGAVTSLKRYCPLPSQIEGLLLEVQPVPLFVMMLNEGNFIDIESWLTKLGGQLSPGQAKWAQIAAAVRAIANDTAFHYLRAKILQPLNQTGKQIDTSLIEQSKAAMLRMPGVPPGVNPDTISWDLVSFKIPFRAIELLAHRHPDLLNQLEAPQIALLDQVEKDSFDLLNQKCAEFRQRTNTVEDELLPDASIFLEQYTGGMKDPERSTKIASMGRGMLIQYVTDMLAIFSSGNLPSTVAPSKIYACHDIISSAELRGSIMKLAEMQVIQQSTVIDSKLIMNRAYALSEGTDYAGRDWTKQQQASLSIKKTVDASMRRVSATFGINYDKPMSLLENKLAGSSNTIGQQMEGHTSDAVLTMNEEQEEIVKHTLSVLLACLRMRANAVQQSAWELLSDQDLDHLEIVKFLSSQMSDASSGTNVLQQISTMMIEEFQDGHNVVKFGGKAVDPLLAEMVLHSLRGKAAMVLRQIPIFDHDLRAGGSGLFDVYIWCLMQSMVQRQRIFMELSERMQRKVVYDSAMESIL